MSFDRAHTKDPDLNAVQDAIASAVDPLQLVPLNSGHLLTSITVGVSAVTTVPHKLGRVLRGWLVVRKRADVRVYDDQDDNATPHLTLRVGASGPAVIDLFVF